MKKQFQRLLLLAFAVPVIFSSCKKSDENADDKFSSASDPQLKTDLVYCGTPLVGPMVNYAQTLSPATVTIGNDGTTLLIKYQLNTPGWFFNLTGLFVGTEAELAALNANVDFDGPGTVYFNSGNPPFGLPLGTGGFGNYGTYWEQLIPLSELPECFIVVAYARIRNESDNSSVDIWGRSALKTPAYYMSYCKQQCETPPPVCETAYAFGGSVANCFLNISGVQSTNWGWSNGPIGAGSYSWPMYAGAGLCNIENGTHVGTLTVNYTPPTATVTYTVFAGYVLNQTHLYVGNQILPMFKGKYTTAPGQFPYKHENLNGVTTDTYNISGLSGSIYVAAHSEVCSNQ
jgi:hypothetical protein